MLSIIRSFDLFYLLHFTNLLKMQRILAKQLIIICPWPKGHWRWSTNTGVVKMYFITFICRRYCIIIEYLSSLTKGFTSFSQAAGPFCKAWSLENNGEQPPSPNIVFCRYTNWAVGRRLGVREIVSLRNNTSYLVNKCHLFHCNPSMLPAKRQNKTKPFTKLKPLHFLLATIWKQKIVSLSL